MIIGINTFALNTIYDKNNPSLVDPFIDSMEHIERWIEIGCRHFEITYDINAILGTPYDDNVIQKLIGLKKKHRLSYSVHLPFRAIDISYPCNELSQSYAHYFSSIIKKLNPLEPTAYVLHTTGEVGKKLRYIDEGSSITKILILRAKNVIEKIIGQTGVSSRMIAVENIKFPFGAMINMIEQLDLSICMDIGHIYAGFSGHIAIDDFISKFSSRIAEIHLHDVERDITESGITYKDHKPMGSGIVDYHSLFRKHKFWLDNIPIILEMNYPENIRSWIMLDNELSSNLQKHRI